MHRFFLFVVTATISVLSPRAWAQQPFPIPEGSTAEAKAGHPSGTKIPVEPIEAESMSAEKEATSTIAPSISLEEPIDPHNYICGPGDVLELNFWGQQNFRLKMAIDLEGRAFISKIGFVAVAGKSLDEVRTLIKKRVANSFPGLKFEVSLLSPRSFSVHLVQNVKQPGIYQTYPLERVSSVLTKAGGVTGSRRSIRIRHKKGGETIADLVKYELTGETQYNPFLLDGDVVTVPHAEVTVSVSGAVRRPGTYELTDTKDINELLTLSGGLSNAATRELPIQLIRRNEQDHEVVRDLAFAKRQPPNEPLRDADIVVVRGMSDLQRTVLLIGAVVGSEDIDAAATSKRLPFIEGDTVRSIIERAGAIRAPGDLKRAYISRPLAGGKTETIHVDLDALLVRRDLKADTTVQIGDTIVIPPMRFSVLVEGAVARAGMYYYDPLFGVPEYIAKAGGRTRTARDMDDVKVIDFSGHTRKYNAGIKLSPGDAILVPERNFTRAEVVQIGLAAAGLIMSGIAITLAATR